MSWVLAYLSGVKAEHNVRSAARCICGNANHKPYDCRNAICQEHKEDVNKTTFKAIRRHEWKLLDVEIIFKQSVVMSLTEA